MEGTDNFCVAEPAIATFPSTRPTDTLRSIKTRRNRVLGGYIECDDFFYDYLEVPVEVETSVEAFQRSHWTISNLRKVLDLRISAILYSRLSEVRDTVRGTEDTDELLPVKKMVQYKRKPVKFDPVPPFLDDNTEVWVIEATQEVYTDYEKYLSRRDYYLQRNFTCESTGHQGYTFFEAMESETEASREINSLFPEGLRSRVLSFVQFRNTARMDDLVNTVYDHFREHFDVGDRVSVEQDNGRVCGIITHMQDTSRLHNMFAPPGDDQFQSFTYTITLEGSGQHITKYKASELQRDRRVYSKLVLKQFLRGAVSREAWSGAPWMVKEHLARRYNISMRVPEAKTRDAVMAAKKAANAANLAHYNHAIQQGLVNGTNPASFNYQGMPGQVMTGHGQTTFVNFSPNGQHPYHNGNGLPMMPHILNGPPGPAHYEHPLHMNQGPPFPHSGPPPQYPQHLPPHLAHLAHKLPPPGPGLPISLPFQNNFMQYQTLAPTNLPLQQATTLSKPFEPIRYPTEDLRIKQPRPGAVRPPLKFFSDDVPEGAEPSGKETGILMKSMGPLLCTWETLNVHDTIYMLDSFTFDDFVDAMRFSSEEVECELLVEVHCSVLKQIVSEEGKLLASLPNIEDSDDSEDDDSSKSTTPEREPTPPVRTTRSSLRKSEANAMVKARTPTPEPSKQNHNAAEFLSEYDWVEQCKIRNFREGGWQASLVGLLYTLSFEPAFKETSDEILAALVPPDESPSVEKIAQHYTYLDVNLRVAALELALRLTVGTEAFRDQLTSASTEMTRLRKEKIEFQKKRKELADELFKLDNERKIQLPLNMPPSPTETKENFDISMTATEDGKDDTDIVSASEEEPQVGNRRLRHTKKNKRKLQADAVKKEKAKKAKVEAAKSKQQQEWEKLLSDIEKKKEELRICEANIAELDDDLRETLVHRSKLVGKDRFLNKYYWFEHNGMPYGGVPNSSTASYGYANGRLWVQGPDEYELQPNLEEPALSQDMAEFGFTIPQRKEKEEGATHLIKSTDWAYYDDPADLDKLMAWLDDRGLREKALRKELQAYRDRIAEYMLKMKAHLEPEKNSNEDEKEEEETTTRVSTRKKTYVEKDATKDRCLLWTNSIMRDEYGYSHAEEYEPPRKTKKGTAKVTKSKSKK